MLWTWTEERRDTGAGLVQNSSGRTKRSVDARGMRQQTHVAAGDQTKSVRLTVGNTIQPGPNLSQ